MKNLISIDRLRDLLPSLEVFNGKPRTDAEFLVTAANNMNRAKVKAGSTSGYQPADGWGGLLPWDIETDENGKPITFKVITAKASRKQVEVSTAIDSVDALLSELEADAETE